MSVPGDGTCKVAAVVLNWNGLEHTQACVRSLSELDRPPDRIFVIDNDSDTNPAGGVHAVAPEAEVVRNRANLGFGGGHNPLLARLLDDDHDWIWLLNNDTRAEADCLARLLEHAAERPDAGVIGACLLDWDPPHAIQAFGGGTVQPLIGRTRHLARPVDESRVDYVTGACMLLRTAALRETGLFDPAFFMYWEDVDLCTRLRRAGWRLAVAGRAVVYHRASGTAGAGSDAQTRMMNASAVRYCRKHTPLRGWPAIVTGIGLRVGKRVLTGRWRSAVMVLRGARDGFRTR